MNSMLNKNKSMDRFSSNSLVKVLVFALVTASFFIYSDLAIASSLSDARKAFSQGDLPKTIQTLESQLFPASKLDKTETVPALELFGISQFMLGEKKSAEKAFRAILVTHPNHTLDKKYALDPAVGPFFDSLKASQPAARKRQPLQSAVKGAGAPKPKRSAARPTPPPEKPRPQPRATPRAAPKAVVTAMVVQTNAPKTTLFIDGIFVGAGNQTITIEPGQHQLTISAEGYDSVDRKISVERGKTLKLSVRLFKAGEAQRLAAARAARKRAAKQKVAKRKQQQKSAFESSGPRATMQFDKALPGEKKGSSPQNSRPRRSLADEFFQEPAPPAYAPQYQQPPGYQVQPPIYQQPQYPYPYPQQAYPAPGYAPQYPPPSYAYPQPDPYAAPPYPPSPPNAYGAPNPYEEEYEAGDGSLPPGGGYSPPPAGGGNRARVRDNGRNTLLALLPFGVGQYQNKHMIKGTLFLLTEVGVPAFGFFYYDSVIKSAQKVFEESRAIESDPNNNYSEADREKNEAERVAILKKYADYQLYTYYATGAIYLLGVIDAFVFINEAPPRQRANREITLPEKAFSAQLVPTFNGGLHLSLSLNLK
ncbi:MAG: hypothetical protein RJB13_473 [Pseudomonadota bacterium]